MYTLSIFSFTLDSLILLRSKNIITQGIIAQVKKGSRVINIDHSFFVHGLEFI